MPGKRIWKIAGIVALLFVFAVIGFVTALYLETTTILPKVYIDSVNVGGLERESALRKIQPVADRLLTHRITFRYQGHSWELNLRELGITALPEAAVDKAAAVGRQGSILKRYRELQAVKQDGLQIELPLVIDQGKLEGLLSSITEDLTTPAVDAQLVIDAQDQVEIIPEKPGSRINLKRAAAAVADSLAYLRQHEHIVIPLVAEPVKPKTSAADLAAMGIKGTLGSFSTYFNANDVNRTYNLHVAADALNNQIIKPGEEFSFNEIVGPRSEEKGYKEALVIVNNQFVPGVGGGVCQVSTTLYNALLQAGLTITERSNHSLVVPYVPPGLDATVAYGGLDLKFRNDTDSHVILRTRISGNRLTISVLGNTDNSMEVRIIRRTEKVLPFTVITKPDPNLAEGKEVVEQEGANGYQASVTRQFYVDGQLVRSELVSKDVYKPLNKIIRRGTKPDGSVIPGTPPAGGEPVNPPVNPTEETAGDLPEENEPPGVSPGQQPEEIPEESPVSPT